MTNPKKQPTKAVFSHDAPGGPLLPGLMHPFA